MDRFNARFNRMFNKILDFYEHWVRRALQRPGLTVAVLSGVFLASLAIYPLLGLAFFPKTDAGQFTINLKVPTGTRIEVTDQYVAKVEDLIRSTMEGEGFEKDRLQHRSGSGFLFALHHQFRTVYGDGSGAAERVAPAEQLRIHGPRAEANGQPVSRYSHILFQRLDGRRHSEHGHAGADRRAGEQP